MRRFTRLRRLIIAGATILATTSLGTTVSYACVNNMDMVKTITGLMADGKFQQASQYAEENLDVCPMQARFYLALLTVEGRDDRPSCDAVYQLEENFSINNSKDNPEILRKSNEDTIVSLLNRIYIGGYIEYSMIEGNTYSTQLYISENQERFLNYLELDKNLDTGYLNVVRLLSYAEQLGVDLNNFPKILEIVGADFERDEYLTNSGWPKSIICDVRK